MIYNGAAVSLYPCVHSAQATHLILDALDARPAGEHEGVVGGEHGDDVDALGLEGRDVLNVRGQVVHVARRLRRKSVRQYLGARRDR